MWTVTTGHTCRPLFRGRCVWPVVCIWRIEMNLWQIRETSTLERLSFGRAPAIALPPSATALPPSAKTCHDLPTTVTPQGLDCRYGTSLADPARPRSSLKLRTADAAQHAASHRESPFQRGCHDRTQLAPAAAVKQQCLTTNRRRSPIKCQRTQSSTAFRFEPGRLHQRTRNWDRSPAMRRRWEGLEGLVHLSPSATSSELSLKRHTIQNGIRGSLAAVLDISR